MLTVLLHALPFDGRMWSEVDRTVSENVLVPDLFMFGDSVAEWAEAILAQAGSEEMLVVGCSVGGSCALELARLAPRQVRGIFLVGAKASVRPDPIARDRAIWTLENQGLEQAWTTYWAPLFGPSTPPHIVSWAREVALSQDVGHIVNGVRAFHDRRDFSEFAASWDKPLVVISGDQDRTPPLSELHALGQGENRHLFVIEDCGHYVNLEQPERLHSILKEINATFAPSAGSQFG